MHGERKVEPNLTADIQIYIGIVASQLQIPRGSVEIVEMVPGHQVGTSAQDPKHVPPVELPQNDVS